MMERDAYLTEQQGVARRLITQHGATGLNAKRTKRMAALRTNAFAALVGLLIEFVLGTTLYGQVPRDAQGRGTFGAFGEVVISGPVPLILHAIVGTLIIVSAATAIIRAILTRSPGLVTLMSVAFMAVLTAWFAGSAFANTLAPAAARAMEWSTAVALLLYAIVLLISSQKSAKKQ